MAYLQEYILELKTLKPELEAVEKKILESITSPVPVVYELACHALTGTGKRLRPLLVILGASFYKADQEAVVDVAAAVELVHTATLVHDDIVDEAEMRRGKVSIYMGYGRHFAVLLGDFLFARSLRLLTPHSGYGVGESLSRAIDIICEGELEQLAAINDYRKSETAYMEEIRKKTGALLAASCEAGAKVSAMPPHETRLLYQFGLDIGCAFQIVDDVLDLTAQSQEVSKSVRLDLSQGKLTLPVIFALSNARQGPLLQQLLINGDINQDQEQIYELVIASGGIDLALARARQFVRQAEKCLDLLPESPYKDALYKLCTYLPERRN